MKKQKLIDPNKTTLNPVWLSAVASSLSRNYDVKVIRGPHWAMDINKKVMTYNDSILSLTKDDALALILHEIGHLLYTSPMDGTTDVYKEAPESSFSVVNALEDFRIDFIMSQEYANSNVIIEKFNQHATEIAFNKLTELQTHQKNWDSKANTLLKHIESEINLLKKNGTPHKELDDTDKFMTVLNNIGYRPRMKRPVDEIMMIATLMYHTPDWQKATDKWKVLKDYQNPKALELAKQILPIFEKRVEHFETTREVQDLWETEIYPLLKDEIDKDQEQPRHNAPTPMSGGGMQNQDVGGKEDAGNNEPGNMNGKVHIDEQTGNVSIDGYGQIGQGPNAVGKSTRGDELADTKAAQASKSYAKKQEGTHQEVNWTRYSQEIKGYLSTAKTQLNRALKENMYNRYAGRHNSGKLNIKKLYKFPMHDFKLFQRKSEIKDKDYAFSLLVDLSGSMEGKLMQETMKGVVLMTETLNKLDQPVEVTFFSSRYKTPKQFHTIVDPVHIGYEATTIRGAGTDIEEPFKKNLESLLKQPTQEKIMITLTDGEFGDDEKTMIKSAQIKHPNVLHYGIGIDVNLSNMFGERAINIKNASEIMPAFAGILRRHIKKLR